MPATPAATIERFHLSFLSVLQVRVPQSAYVLKGGVNLRYFFDSVRYSEDIDLDTSGLERWVLEERVDAILASDALRILLRSGGISIREPSKPKQTETTQRWKVPLEVSGLQKPVRTQIEFSRRNGESRLELAAVPGRIVQPYAIRAPTLQHYLAAAAIEQKVYALEERSETQARDVFDLDLLLRRAPLAKGAVPAATLAAAAERAIALPHEAFVDQVRPFLDDAVSELYGDRAVWAQIQGFVVERLLEG